MSLPTNPKPTASIRKSPRQSRAYWRDQAAANQAEAVAMKQLAEEETVMKEAVARKMVEFAQMLHPSEGDEYQRASNAHRAAFALITQALTEPDALDLDAHLTDDKGQHRVGPLLDVVAALTWHAAGAILTHTGSVPAALELVQSAALMQETKTEATE